MDWKEYAKELLIFQVKVFSLPIEDVSKEKIEEFKSEFNELKKMGKLDWDAEAFVEDYYDAIGKIVDVGKRYDKSLGIMVSNKHDKKFYEDLWFNIIAVVTEMAFLTESIKCL